MASTVIQSINGGGRTLIDSGSDSSYTATQDCRFWITGVVSYTGGDIPTVKINNDTVFQVLSNRQTNPYTPYLWNVSTDALRRDVSIVPNGTYYAVIGIDLEKGDTITGYSGTYYAYTK